jgi:hypothetical protein
MRHDTISDIARRNDSAVEANRALASVGDATHALRLFTGSLHPLGSTYRVEPVTMRGNQPALDQRTLTKGAQRSPWPKGIPSMRPAIA